MSGDTSYPSELFDLTDRVVLITGGSRGLGREMAFAAARCGADVVMSPTYDSLADVTEKLFDTVVNLNLKGPFRLSVLAGERMVADGGGVIINVSTHGSLRPHPSFLPYAAAKAGLNALTEGLAIAYGPTVRVNTLMPGPFLTDVSKAWNLADINPVSRHPLGRAGEPAEIVGAALFLMSDASSFTTGSILRADGGLPG